MMAVATAGGKYCSIYTLIRYMTKILLWGKTAGTSRRPQQLLLDKHCKSSHLKELMQAVATATKDTNIRQKSK